MKRVFAILIALAMVFSSTIPAYAAPDAKKAPTWIVDGFAAAKAKGAAIANVPGVSWNRGNASGDKITSNAHSMDFDGIYFEWDEKQKDPGVLLVREDVFDLFVNETFKVTAKNSSSYYGYQVSKSQTGNIVYSTTDGLDVYGYVIPKQVQNEKGKSEDLKNINMIFIDGDYKPASFEIEKVWLDANGFEITGDNSLVSFKEGWKLGTNEVKVKDFATAVKGIKVTATEKPIAGYTTVSKNPQSLTVTWSTQVMTFVNQADPIVVKGNLSLEKWIDGASALAWNNPTDLALSDLMSFKLYTATAEKNGYSGDSLATSLAGYLDNGDIFFDYNFNPGWYAVVEVLSDEGAKYFEPAAPLYVYISEVDTTYSPVDGSFSLESREGVEVYNMITDMDDLTVLVNVPQMYFWNQEMRDANSSEFVAKLLDGKAEFVWDEVETHTIYGETGSFIKVTDTLKIPGEIDGDAILYLACDNAALVFVNGQYAGGTDEAFKNRDARPSTIFGNLNHGDFDSTPEAWRIIYDLDITPFLTSGSNEIVFYAANTMNDPENYPGYDYTTENNPCGLIYSVEVGYKGVRFDNNTVVVPKGVMEVIPMFSCEKDSSNIDAGNNPVWGNWTGGYQVFEYYDDEDGFTNSLDDAIRPVWAKEQGTEPLGYNAYFSYEYQLSGDRQKLLAVTDFSIFADNAFVLFINGEFIGASGNVAATEGELKTAYNAANGNADIFFNGIERYNETDYDGSQDYNFANTNKVFDVETALKEAVASGSVRVEIYAYNTPQCDDTTGEKWVHGSPNLNEGNPACVIFACTFAYEYFND